MAIAVAFRIDGLPSLSQDPVNREVLLQRETNMLGDLIDNSRNGSKQHQTRLENRYQDFQENPRGHRSRWGRNIAKDPWLLACFVLLGLAIFTTAAWLILAVFHTPARFLSILETQGIEGLWEMICLFCQRL